jgi:hypothetical protein
MTDTKKATAWTREHAVALSDILNIAVPSEPMEEGEQRTWDKAAEGLEFLSNPDTHIVNRRDAVQVAELLRDFVNGTWDKDLRFVGRHAAGEMLDHGMHPTLQQKFAWIVLAYIEAMAEKRYVDGRNEYIHELCKKLHPIIANHTGGTFGVPLI